MKPESGQDTRQLQFFATPEHACSYLDNRAARTLFLDPRVAVSAVTYQTLSVQGFRRSGGHLYRPECAGCNACVPTRIPVADFRPKRSQRRVLARNDDVTIEVRPAVFDHETYALYARYIAARHRDGDMYPASEEQFRTFLLSQWADTQFLCAYINGRLSAVAVTDRLPHSLSAIYTFFDPDVADRSLGVFCILQQIEFCRAEGLEHLYLGYWIRDAAKMAYKTDYRPIELLVQNRWLTLR